MSRPPPSRERSGVAQVRVWDPVVRFTHWAVALGCFTDLALIGGFDARHEYVGYGVVACVLVRIVWGFTGTTHARFTDFVASRPQIQSYVGLSLKGREPRYLGHNPAGSLMMLTLIGLVLVCAGTGIMMGLDALWGNAAIEALHETAAYLILAAACVHVAGAIVESVRHRENLIWSMITGRKRAPIGTDVHHAREAKEE
jgi:cytochrome b